MPAVSSAWPEEAIEAKNNDEKTQHDLDAIQGNTYLYLTFYGF